MAERKCRTLIDRKDKISGWTKKGVKEKGTTTATTTTRKCVGKYKIGKTLGEGSFAKVVCAQNVETGHIVAIKIIHRQLVLRHKMVEQIKREISTMKLIKHPNVIQICLFWHFSQTRRPPGQISARPSYIMIPVTS